MILLFLLTLIQLTPCTDLEQVYCFESECTGEYEVVIQDYWTHKVLEENTYRYSLDLSEYVGEELRITIVQGECVSCLLYTSPSPRDATLSRMPSSA